MKRADKQVRTQLPGEWFAMTPRGRHRVHWAGVVVMVFFGTLFLWPVEGRPVWGAVLGGGMLASGVVGAASLVVRTRMPPPQVLVADVDGRPATAILREPWVFVIGLVLAVVLGLVPGVGAMLAAARGHWFWATVLMLVAWSAWGLVVHAARGRYIAGGVWLTPQHVIYRSYGLESTAAWEDLEEVADMAWHGLVGLSTGRNGTVEHRLWAGPWRGERVPASHAVVIRVESMTFDTAELTRVLNHYLHHPAARAELGTPASLTTIAAITGRPA